MPNNRNQTGSILTINGGSSSIKFALFERTKRILTGQIKGVGLPQGRFEIKSIRETENISRPVAVSDHHQAVNRLMDWLEPKMQSFKLSAVGHRVVHGGPKYWEPQRLTAALLRELKALSPIDPEHLPEEILLTEAFHRRFPKLLQVVCFDTGFHHDLPRVARILPIPRRYQAKGIRRYGFHGLSCAYLMEELGRVAGKKAANGRVVLAHLGSGASITAVRAGQSRDTTMSFTPASGLPMSSRAGDLDPSLGWYLSQTEQMTGRQFHRMINHESGLLGISGISSDMLELRALAKNKVPAAEAVEIFCYQAKKWICAFAGVLSGLDTLVFAGGIGENSPGTRAEICAGLDFLGLKLDKKANESGSALISAKESAVTVRVIKTDEESIIAKMLWNILKSGVAKSRKS